MLQWVAVDLLTGAVIADLPDLQAGAAKKTLMRYETNSASLPLDTAPSAWLNATRPYSSALVCLDDAGAVPLWGGIVTSRKRGWGGTVSLDLASAESYFEARYVGNVWFEPGNWTQGDIVEWLVNTYAVASGPPFRVQHDGDKGMLRERRYTDRDDKSLYEVLGELAGVIDGPEWTVDWEPRGDGFAPFVRTAKRLGSPAPAGLSPNALFTMPGCVTGFELVESYKSGVGANDVMAVSSGSEDARPQSPKQVATGDNRPKVEHRWSPSTSITDVATLTDHAKRALAAMKGGSVALTMSANRDEAPKLGADWRLGDDLAFDLEAPGFPDGLSGVARAVGWELDDTTITPILELKTVEGI